MRSGIKKRCCRCGLTLPTTAYRRVASSDDGFCWRCRDCEARAVADQAARAAVGRAAHILSDGPFALAVMSHKEVGAAMGISHSRVAQIERSALAKLKAIAERKGLR